MKPQATRETLEAIAEEACKLSFSEGCSLEKALRQYRAELRPPLRTREEVDAEIVLLSRQYYAGIGGTQSGLGAIYERLKAACAEPTREPEGVENTPQPSDTCDWCDDSKRPFLSKHVTPARTSWICPTCRDTRCGG